MIRRTRLFSAIIAIGLPAVALALTPPMPRNFDVIYDAHRPPEDVARDADRKPLEMLNFARVYPGQTVVDYIPGRGYFTRLFSAVVGSKGTVYAATPQMLIDMMAKRGATLPPSVTTEPGRGNVHDTIVSGGSFHIPVKVDLVWTSQNYHDVHIGVGAVGAEALDKAVFDLLKPGGLFVVLDHAGAAGLDEAGTAKLHRIDEAVVKKEVLAAGFVLDAESDVLRNPADPHTANVFDPSIRGHTDQFVLRFRKPG